MPTAGPFFEHISSKKKGKRKGNTRETEGNLLRLHERRTFTCRGEALLVVPPLPPPEQFVCLLPGCSGPLLFQVGRQHPSTFVIFKPFHDGIAVSVCRLLLVPPSVGEVAASPFAISQVFPVYLGVRFSLALPESVNKSVILERCIPNHLVLT